MVDSVKFAQAVDSATAITNYDKRIQASIQKGELYELSADPDLTYRRFNKAFAPVEQATGATPSFKLYKYVVPFDEQIDDTTGGLITVPRYALKDVNSVDKYFPVYATGIEKDTEDRDVEFFLVEKENIKFVCFNPVDLMEAAQEYLGLPCVSSASVGFQSESYNTDKIPMRLQKVFDYYTRAKVTP